MTVTDQPIATTRRADVPKRPRTPGARERDLTRAVDYGGDVGVVVETYARQTVVDAYPPGASEPVTVTEKAYANIYASAGWTLQPNPDAPGPLADDDRLASAARLTDEAERARADAEEEAERLIEKAETARRAQERAEAKAAEEASARAAAEEETARLRAELEAARAAALAPPPDAPETPVPPAEEPAPAGGKARKS